MADSYGDAGIGAPDLHEAVDVYHEMLGREDVTNFFGLMSAMVVGGVPKNYVLQTMLVAPEAYDYAVQLTMDPPLDRRALGRDARRGALVEQA